LRLLHLQIKCDRANHLHVAVLLFASGKDLGKELIR